ncbi:alpha/beta fold hydrolase [Chloroflexota bacterium]
MQPDPSFAGEIPSPPPAEFGDIDLPNTRLHYVRSGSGQPLIIVPATVSLIRQWLPLAQFIGMRYNAHFFEMPGHGGSTPYPHKFKSEYLPETVEAFADKLGFERFNLMGFSFGGLLAMRTLEQLQSRIDRVILLSPLVSKRALKFSTAQMLLLQTAVAALRQDLTQETAVRILQNDNLEKPLISLLSRISNIEKSILESKDTLKIPITTLDVFAHTMGEILEMEYQYNGPPFETPCYFGMSVNDDMLEYKITEPIVRQHFTNIQMQQFDLPYHQPPLPPTFEWLYSKFSQFLDLVG